MANNELSLTLSVTLTNTGTVSGSQVVQIYVSMPKTSHLTHPPLQLKGFAKARDVAPGEARKVEVTLDKYAVSYWEENLGRWVVEKGVYGLTVGTGDGGEEVLGEFKVEKGFEWNGL